MRWKEGLLSHAWGSGSFRQRHSRFSELSNASVITCTLWRTLWYPQGMLPGYTSPFRSSSLQTQWPSSSNQRTCSCGDLLWAKRPGSRRSMTWLWYGYIITCRTRNPSHGVRWWRSSTYNPHWILPSRRCNFNFSILLTLFVHCYATCTLLFIGRIIWIGSLSCLYIPTHNKYLKKFYLQFCTSFSFLLQTSSQLHIESEQLYNLSVLLYKVHVDVKILQFWKNGVHSLEEIVVLV